MNIQRNHKTARMSQTVVHNGVVYLAGQVPDDFRAPVVEQARQVLAKIERLLTEVGSDRSKLLSAQLWLADINDFEAVNGVWEAWIDADNPPARATCAVTLAHPDIRVEIVATAAA